MDFVLDPLRPPSRFANTGDPSESEKIPFLSDSIGTDPNVANESVASSIYSAFANLLTSISNGISGLFADSPQSISDENAIEDEVLCQWPALSEAEVAAENLDNRRYDFALQLFSVGNLTSDEREQKIDEAVAKLNYELDQLNEKHPIAPQGDKASNDHVLNKKVLSAALDRMPQTFFVQVLKGFVAKISADPTADRFINCNEAVFISFLMSQARVEIKRLSQEQQQQVAQTWKDHGGKYLGLKKTYDAELKKHLKSLGVNQVNENDLPENLKQLKIALEQALGPLDEKLEKIEALNRQRQSELKAAETLEFLSYTAWLMPDYHAAFDYLVEKQAYRFTPNRNVTTNYSGAAGVKVGFDAEGLAEMAEKFNLGFDPESFPFKAYAQLLLGVSHEDVEFTDHEGYACFPKKVVELFVNAKGEFKFLFDFNKLSDSEYTKLGVAGLLEINVAPYSVVGKYSEYGTVEKLVGDLFHDKNNCRSNSNTIERSGHERPLSLVNEYLDDAGFNKYLNRFSRWGIQTDLYDVDEVADIDVVMQKFDDTYKKMHQTLSIFVSSTNFNESNEVNKTQLKSLAEVWANLDIKKANQGIETLKLGPDHGIVKVQSAIQIEIQDTTSNKTIPLYEELPPYRGEHEEEKFARQHETDIKIHRINTKLRINKLNIDFLFELLPLKGEQVEQKRTELIEERLQNSIFLPAESPLAQDDSGKFEAISRKYEIVIEKEYAKSRIEELKLISDFEVKQHERNCQPKIDEADDAFTESQEDEKTKWSDDALTKKNHRAQLVFDRDYETRKKEHALKLAELGIKNKFDLLVAKTNPATTAKVHEEYELELLRLTAKFDKDELKHVYVLELACEKRRLEFRKEHGKENGKKNDEEPVKQAELDYVAARRKLKYGYAVGEKKIDKDLALNELGIEMKFAKDDRLVVQCINKEVQLIKQFDLDLLRLKQPLKYAKLEDQANKVVVLDDDKNPRSSKKQAADDKLALMQKHDRKVNAIELQPIDDAQSWKIEKLEKLNSKLVEIQTGAMELFPNSEKNKQKKSSLIELNSIQSSSPLVENVIDLSGKLASDQQAQPDNFAQENDYANWATARPEAGIELPHPTLAKNRIYSAKYTRGRGSVNASGTAGAGVISGSLKGNISGKWTELSRQKFTTFGVRLTSPLKSIEEKEGLHQRIVEELDLATSPTNPTSVKNTIINGWKAGEDKVRRVPKKEWNGETGQFENQQAYNEKTKQYEDVYEDVSLGVDDAHFTIEQCMTYLQEDIELYAQCYGENGIIKGYETIALKLQERYAATEPWEIIKRIAYFVGHLIGLAKYGKQYQVVTDTATDHYIDKKEVLALQEKLKVIENSLFNLKADKPEHWMEWGIWEYGTVFVESADLNGSVEGGIDLGGYVEAGGGKGGNVTLVNRRHPVAGRNIPTIEVVKRTTFSIGSGDAIPDAINGPLLDQIKPLLTQLSEDGPENLLGASLKVKVDLTETDRYIEIPRFDPLYERLKLPVPGKVLAYSYKQSAVELNASASFSLPLTELTGGQVPISPTVVGTYTKTETEMRSKEPGESEKFSANTFNHFDIFHSHALDIGDKDKHWRTVIKIGQRNSLNELWCKLGKEQLEEDVNQTPLSNELAVRALEFKENKVLPDLEKYWEFDDATKELREMATYLYAVTDGQKDLKAMKLEQKSTPSEALDDKIYVLEKTISMAKMYFLGKGLRLNDAKKFDADKLYEYCFDIFDKWEVAYYPHVRELFENSKQLNMSTVGVNGKRQLTYDGEQPKVNKVKRFMPRNKSPSANLHYAHDTTQNSPVLDGQHGELNPDPF